MNKRVYKNLFIIAIGLFTFASAAYAVTSGAGTSILNGTVATDSNTKDFLYSSASDISCTGTPAPTGKLVIDTTDTILQWCSGNTIKYVATGNTTGAATALTTGDGSDGSRGITFRDNSGSPVVPTPAPNYMTLHSQGQVLYALPNGGTAPGTQLLPQTKVLASTQTGITSLATAITELSSFTIAASRKYIIEGFLQVTVSVSTADPSVQLKTSSSTTGCSVRINLNNAQDGVTTAVAPVTMVAFGTNYTATTGNTNDILILLNGTIQGCNGSVTFDLAEGPAGTGTNTILAGSWLRVTQIP